MNHRMTHYIEQGCRIGLATSWHQKRALPLTTPCLSLSVVGLLLCLFCTTRAAAADQVNADLSPTSPTLHTVVADVGAYVTSPLHWDSTDWGLFGGSIAAITLAHHYDSSVRNHFTRDSTTALDGKDVGALQDAVPAATVLAGTWLYGTIVDDSSAKTAAWAMTESAGLSAAATYLFKAIAGRERPNQTIDPNRWRAGGTSFPSLHVSVAFAIGTSFAESGIEGSSRWLTRTVGYGMAGLTAYRRLQHNAHWLSDAVAGAAIGTATGLFVTKRIYGTNVLTHLTLSPTDGGMVVSYHAVLAVD
jgi:membrane-associated phospholipid phosphatase